MIRGILGYADSNGVYAVKEPTDTAQYRVRLDNRSFVTAYHNGVCAPTPDLAVWLEIDELGRYIIRKVDLTVAITSNRDNPSQVFTAPHSHGRGSGMEFPIDPRLLSPFQIRVVSGLQVYINGGAYQYEGQWKWFGGDTIDLTSSIPGAANRHRWVVFVLDHPTSTINLVLGALQATTSPLTLEQIESITVTGIPVGAIRLKYGQTAILETDMEALHILAHSYPKHNYTATTTPTVNDDELDGYGVDSRWFDQINQIPYTCIDASAGAAVWVSGGGSGTAVPVTADKKQIETEILLHDETLSSSGSFSVNLGALEQCEDLRILLIVRGSSANNRFVRIQFNLDTTVTNYRQQHWQGSGAIAGAGTANDNNVMFFDGSNSIANHFTAIEMELPRYRNTTMIKTIYGLGGLRSTATAMVGRNSFLSWNNTSAINNIAFIADSGDFIAGSRLIIWGKKSIEVVTGVSGTQSEYFPIELDYEETIPTNRQIVLSHVNIVDGGDLIVNGTVVFVGDDE